MHLIQMAAAEIIGEVIKGGQNLNRLYKDCVSQKGTLSAQEKGLLKDITYGPIRTYTKQIKILSILTTKGVADPTIKNLLVVALYQLQNTKAGEYTVVNETVKAAKKINSRMAGFVNAVLREYQRRSKTLLAEVEKTEETKYSYPLWWIQRLQEQYGKEAADSIMREGNKHPLMTLRVNRRKNSLQEYEAQLEKKNIEATINRGYAITLKEPSSVDGLPGFREGKVSVQDAGAQWAAELLDLKNGMRVLDACAAPGGKTAHMLEIRELELTALEKDPVRAKRIEENLTRLQLKAQIQIGDAENPELWWDGKKYQRILADVPCSATGVVRKHPDIKWLRRKEDLKAFANQQSAIIKALWGLLEPKGKMLYCTCSIFREENRDVIEAFLQQTQDAEEIPLAFIENMAKGQLLITEEHDGFFYALLQKKG